MALLLHSEECNDLRGAPDPSRCCSQPPPRPPRGWGAVTVVMGRRLVRLSLALCNEGQGLPGAVGVPPPAPWFTFMLLVMLVIGR
jgi:hypothetical protein